jgi:Fanconi anemia group M protein
MPAQFFDIFSKPSQNIKRKKEKPKPKIIIDIREKNSLINSELVGLGLETEFQTLKVGDYLVGEVAIERKTVSDFISSLINKRLANQLEELQQYPNKLLVIEGIEDQELYTDSEDRIGMHPNAIRGFLLSILLKYKVPIIFTKDYRDTAKFISVLAKKTEKEPSLNVMKKSLNRKERMQFILESFPGIGPKNAKKLLEKFKTLKEIFNTPMEELKKEIGKKAEIFRMLDENY